MIVSILISINALAGAYAAILLFYDGWVHFTFFVVTYLLGCVAGWLYVKKVTKNG